MIHQGHVLDKLAEIEPESVHCVMTSIPYWKLQDYKLPPQVWDDPGGCEHEWQPSIEPGGQGDGLSFRRDRKAGRKRGGHQPGFCRKCNAWRGSLGLEPTPELYIQHVVEVFREVRRVMRSDATCWLNIGDSYANDGKWGGESSGKNTASGAERRRTETGLKPKNLCMMSARVALALQAPYYTGRIKNKEDRIWLAALIDTEGCIFVHKRKKGQSNGQGYYRKHDSYGAGLEVANCSKAIIDRCKNIAGIGSICEQGPQQNKRRKQIIYRWNVRSNECRWILKEVYPHLIRKQHEARLAISCPSSGVDAEKAHLSLIAIHRGQKSTIDFPAPEPLYEPGWWVRSDIIWKKLNPMPESVTDRPTRSHEYIFLLTKAARYYYDAEAVREKVTGNAHVRSAAASEYPGTGERDENRRRPGVNPKAVEPGKGIKQNSSFSAAVHQLVSNRNLRSVWEIATQPFPEAHFATFPEKLVARCIMAGTSEKGCCPKCGAPWERSTKPSDRYQAVLGEGYHDHSADLEKGMKGVRGTNKQNKMRDAGIPGKELITTGWRPTCECGKEPVPAVVLDPFLGSGTVIKVAQDLGRAGIGIELNPEYCEMARERTKYTQELLRLG